MKNRILSALLVVLSLAMFVGCGRQEPDNNTANPPDRTEQQNNSVGDLPNASDNGSNVQGDKNGIGDDRKPDGGKSNNGSVTQDAKDILDDAGDMVGDAAQGVGDAVQDVGDATKDATDNVTRGKPEDKKAK